MTGVVITSLLDLVTLMASALEMALSLRGVRDRLLQSLPEVTEYENPRIP